LTGGAAASAAEAAAREGRFWDMHELPATALLASQAAGHPQRVIDCLFGFEQRFGRLRAPAWLMLPGALSGVSAAGRR
jgi:hypothetical protein